MIPVLDVTKRWACPSCGLLHITNEPRPHTPMHSCAVLGGLLAPFVEVVGGDFVRGSARHVVAEREDYIGTEHGVTHDAEGRAVMAVRTERADGSNDVHVFAPTAKGNPSQ